MIRREEDIVRSRHIPPSSSISFQGEEHAQQDPLPADMLTNSDGADETCARDVHARLVQLGFPGEREAYVPFPISLLLLKLLTTTGW